MNPEQECLCPHHSVCKPCKATINTHIDRLNELKEKPTHFYGLPNKVLYSLPFTNRLTHMALNCPTYQCTDGGLPFILTENAVALLFFLTHHSNVHISLSSNIADSNINK